MIRPPGAELEALLRLRCVPRLGPARLHHLLSEHGSAEAVLRLPWDTLGPEGHERDSPRTAERVRRALRVIDELGVQVLAGGSDVSPSAFQQLRHPPVLLFLRGDARLLGSGGVAVIGTRRPAEYGAGVAAQLAAGIAAAGVTVWSGLARGIDGIAHGAALEAGGGTVAVLGSGIDVPYPREHAALAERVATDGLLVSEYLPGEPPLAHHFPARNRILACLASAVLVVEAREDGGALITAEQALDLGRAVLAVPGPIGRVTSYGPNRLIQDGAKLVMDVSDVLEELGHGLNARAARPRPSARRHWRPVVAGGRGRNGMDSAPVRAGAGGSRASGGTGGAGNRAAPPASTQPNARLAGVLAALEHEGRHVDEIAVRAGLPAAKVLALLLELELGGRVRHLGGSRYAL